MGLSLLTISPVVLAQPSVKPAVAMDQKTRMAIEQQVRQALTNPTNAPVGNSPIKGPKNAPLTLIEFADFQCPACFAARDSFLKPLLGQYTGKIRLVFKHYPLPQHDYAISAAKAAWAAQQQGKFYEYYELLFNNQKLLTAQKPPEREQTLLKLAQQLKLDPTRFNKDRTSLSAEEAIKADMQLGNTIGLQGTPTFVLNGIQLSAATQPEVIKVIVEVLKKDKGVKV